MDQLSDREKGSTESLSDLALSNEQVEMTKGGTSERSGGDENIIIAGAGGSCCHIK